MYIKLGGPWGFMEALCFDGEKAVFDGELLRHDFKWAAWRRARSAGGLAPADRWRLDEELGVEARLEMLSMEGICNMPIYLLEC